jgi:glycosyltransferase involved in cell wall biosynthesis
MIPSYREGFGNANVEAQAMKVPVVCYSVTGCVDSVQNGVSGFSVPFLDILALKEAVQTLIEDEKLRTLMGEQAREFVQTKFTIDKVAANNVEFILN